MCPAYVHDLGAQHRAFKPHWLIENAHANPKNLRPTPYALRRTPRLLHPHCLPPLPHHTQVGRDHPGSGWRVCGQALCACLLIGGATAAIIGLALPADVGQQCGSFCSDASCLPVSWWECVGVGSSPNGCHLTVLANGTQAMECPSVSALCAQGCNGAALRLRCLDFAWFAAAPG